MTLDIIIHKENIAVKVLNIGSMNLDYVYHVDHIVQPGETEAADSLNVFLGGKGMNQSVALAKAGADVFHAGLIGEDGRIFPETCREYGVDASFIREVDIKTGHAIIQIDRGAQNCILLYGGANQALTESYVDEVLSAFESGDMLLLQNEVNLLPYIVDRAWEKGMQIALNPSPFNDKLREVDLSRVSVFLLNEVEGNQVTGFTDPESSPWVRTVRSMPRARCAASSPSSLCRQWIPLPRVIPSPAISLRASPRVCPLLRPSA